MLKLLLRAALALPIAASAQTLGFGTAPQGTIGYNMGSAIAKVIAETEKLQSRVQPYSGSSAILPLVSSGELDLSVCNVLEAQEAALGAGPYNGRRQANLRVLAVIFPIHVGLFVRKDSPIRSLADIKGKRIPYGYSAQLTLNRVNQALLATAGLSEKDIVPVMVPNVARGADDFAEGKADAGFFAIGAAKVTEVDKTTGGIRFLSVPNDPQGVAAMKKIIEFAYVNEVKPSPAFAGIAEPTRLMAYDYLVVAGAHVKDEVIYKVARALHDHKAKLVESLRAFGGFNPATMHKAMPAPFHPGALKYYKEIGLLK
ncbi:MAG: TAXI family TRAP transporter solute-binding subunit [Betaproteobacteria bacterium]|nr:TAXI family TRAP transporter solute-binding subunit [Betaproteobacteria bacterium]